MGEEAFLSSPGPARPVVARSSPARALRAGDGGMALAGVRGNSVQVSVEVAEIRSSAACLPRAGERRKTVRFSMWMMPIFLGLVLFAAAMILFYLREAASVDRTRKELAGDDIKRSMPESPNRRNRESKAPPASIKQEWAAGRAGRSRGSSGISRR